MRYYTTSPALTSIHFWSYVEAAAVLADLCFIQKDKIHSSREQKTNNLSDPDTGLWCSDTVVEVTGISLSVFGSNSGRGLDSVGGAVTVVGGFQCGLILGADGREDGVGSGNGGFLGGLNLGTWVGARVEKDEGTLFVGDGGEVSGGNSILQGGDTGSVRETSTLNGSCTDGTIGRGHGRGGNEGGSCDGTDSCTTVHVQGGSSTL